MTLEMVALATKEVKAISCHSRQVVTKLAMPVGLGPIGMAVAINWLFYVFIFFIMSELQLRLSCSSLVAYGSGLERCVYSDIENRKT